MSSNRLRWQVQYINRAKLKKRIVARFLNRRRYKKLKTTSVKSMTIRIKNPKRYLRNPDVTSRI